MPQIIQYGVRPTGLVLMRFIFGSRAQTRHYADHVLYCIVRYM